jgi:hypothetical protein
MCSNLFVGLFEGTFSVYFSKRRSGNILRFVLCFREQELQHSNYIVSL